jgi:hypothetical protein
VSSNSQEYNQRWREANKEAIRDSNQKYRLAHAEKISKQIKIRYQRLRDSGLCVRCTNPREKHKQYCDSCLKKHNAEVKKCREKHIKSGLCRACGLPREQENKVHCNKCLMKYRDDTRKNQERFRHTALSFLTDGKMCCSNCGLPIYQTLEFDHINNDGAEHRRREAGRWFSFPKWLIDNNFPNGFQVLCANCHSFKTKGGKLPTKNELIAAYETAIKFLE